MFTRLELEAVGGALVLAAALLALHHYGATRYADGQAEVNARWNAEKVVQLAAARQADADNRTTEFNRQEATNAAISQARQQGADDARSTAAAHTAAGSLRGALARRATAAPADVSRESLDACRRDVAARDAVLGDMAEAGADMAGAADGHATDSLMYQRAWPKK